jgi:hypothetical protein
MGVEICDPEGKQVVQKDCLQKSYGNLNFLSFFLKVSFFIKR